MNSTYWQTVEKQAQTVKKSLRAGPAVALLLALTACGGDDPAASNLGPPNIVIVMTDDQGWAQLGAHGNQVLRTPNLDRLAGKVWSSRGFYVSPVCSPTRASLMTGRYNYRTGVVDVSLGRAMMHTEETTLAEILRDGGYRTGIFGKWHLGDSYPMRPLDQGFEQALVHRGWGIGSPGTLRDGLLHPILQHNGEEKQFEGYCTEVSSTPPCASSNSIAISPSSPTWPPTAHTRPTSCPSPTASPIAPRASAMRTRASTG